MRGSESTVLSPCADCDSDARSAAVSCCTGAGRHVKITVRARSVAIGNLKIAWSSSESAHFTKFGCDLAAPALKPDTVATKRVLTIMLIRITAPEWAPTAFYNTGLLTCYKTALPSGRFLHHTSHHDDEAYSSFLLYHPSVVADHCC
jgi:hypothetical protein